MRDERQLSLSPLESIPKSAKWFHCLGRQKNEGPRFKKKYFRFQKLPRRSFFLLYSQLLLSAILQKSHLLIFSWLPCRSRFGRYRRACFPPLPLYWFWECGAFLKRTA